MFYDEKGVYVVDDFISEERQDWLIKFFVENEEDEPNSTPTHFPYYFNATTNGKYNTENTRLINNRNTFDHYQFTHMFWYEGNVASEWGNYVVPQFIPSFNEFFGCDDYQILRCKLNLTTPHPRNGKIISPHTDGQQKTWSIVYFVNEVPNSFTLIGKDLWDGKKKNKFRISKKIKCKKGRAILFDSRRFHSAGRCPDGYFRMVINIIIGHQDEL